MRALATSVRGLTALVLTACALGLMAGDVQAQPTTSALALGRLKAGNDRFAQGAPAPLATGASTRETVARQSRPFAMVLSCADARVPPELVFNAGLGDLYVVRSLGGVADKAVVASLEHGVTALGVPLLVVMGHESCDLVGRALSGEAATGAAQEYVLAAIRTGTDRLPADRRDLRSAVLATVEQEINDVLGASEPLRQAVGAGRLQVVGAYYELTSGRVIFSEPAAAATATK